VLVSSLGVLAVDLVIRVERLRRRVLPELKLQWAVAALVLLVRVEDHHRVLAVLAGNIVYLELQHIMLLAVVLVAQIQIQQVALHKH
jgi:hypothetical protein